MRVELPSRSSSIEDFHVLDRCRWPAGAAAECRDVAEVVHVAAVVCELFKHRVRGHAARDCRIARGHAFCHCHKVGFDAELLVAEPCAGAPKAADDFVDVQQDVVLSAKLLHAFPIAFGGDDDAAACCDRFKAERPDGVGALAQDHVLDRFERGGCVGLACGAVL